MVPSEAIIWQSFVLFRRVRKPPCYFHPRESSRTDYQTVPALWRRGSPAACASRAGLTATRHPALPDGSPTQEPPPLAALWFHHPATASHHRNHHFIPPPMTAFQELQAFAQALSPFCQANGLRLICPHSVPGKDLAPGTSVLPCLVLAQAAEDLTCGHVMPTAERGNLFIPVRTPFAASATLKFVNLRSYTLTLAQESRAAGLRLDPAAAARPQPGGSVGLACTGHRGRRSG